MSHSRPLFWIAITALAAAPLSAQSVGTDTDGDGLDDLLEARFGTSATAVDTDGDGLTDLEEVLGGSRPTLVDTRTPAALGTPTVHVEAYASGAAFVLQVYLVHTASVTDFRLSWWTGPTTVSGDLAALAPYLAGNQLLTLPSVSGAAVQSLRFVLPRPPIQAAGATAMTASATVDGFRMADSLSLLEVQGVFVEVRWLETAASGAPALGATARDQAYLSVLNPSEVQGTDDEPVLDFLCILSFPDGYTVVNPYQIESTVTMSQCLPLAGASCAPWICSSAAGQVVRFDTAETYYH